MRKYSLISLLFCCSIVFWGNQAYASLNKDEVDLDSVKAPPRDVRDILRLFDTTKQDSKDVEKAKAIRISSRNSNSKSKEVDREKAKASRSSYRKIKGKQK